MDEYEQATAQFGGGGTAVAAPPSEKPDEYEQAVAEIDKATPRQAAPQRPEVTPEAAPEPPAEPEVTPGQQEAANRIHHALESLNEEPDRWFGKKTARFITGLVPFAGGAYRIAELADLSKAKKRINSGDYTDSDIMKVAKAIGQEEYDKSKGKWERVGEAAMGLPGLGVEFAATGGIAGGIRAGVTKGLTSLAERHGARMAMQGAVPVLASGAGRLSINVAAGAAGAAAQTALLPSMGVEGGMQDNMQKGRALFDARGFGKSVTVGTVQLGIMHLAGVGAAKLGPQGTGLLPAAGRTGLQGAGGVLIGSGAHAATSAAGLTEGYDLYGDVAKGEYQEAMTKGAIHAMNFMAFHIAGEVRNGMRGPETVLPIIERVNQRARELERGGLASEGPAMERELQRTAEAAARDVETQPPSNRQQQTDEAVVDELRGRSEPPERPQARTRDEVIQGVIDDIESSPPGTTATIDGKTYRSGTKPPRQAPPEAAVEPTPAEPPVQASEPAAVEARQPEAPVETPRGWDTPGASDSPVVPAADIAGMRHGLPPGFHVHPAQEKIPALATGWVLGEDGHWQKYPERAAGISDADISTAARRTALPLPKGGEEAAPMLGKAWDMVSRLWPEMAKEVKAVRVVDFGERPVRAAINDREELIVPKGKEVRPDSLWHELVHLEQRQQGREVPQKERSEAQHIEMEREAYSRAAQMSNSKVWDRLEAATGAVEQSPEQPAAPSPDTVERYRSALSALGFNAAKWKPAQVKAEAARLKLDQFTETPAAPQVIRPEPRPPETAIEPVEEAKVEPRPAQPVDKFIGKMGREYEANELQHELPGLEDEGITPAKLSDRFFAEVYPDLDATQKAEVERVIYESSSIKPGEVLGTDRDGTDIVAKDWKDLSPFKFAGGGENNPSFRDLIAEENKSELGLALFMAHKLGLIDAEQLFGEPSGTPSPKAGLIGLKPPSLPAPTAKIGLVDRVRARGTKLPPIPEQPSFVGEGPRAPERQAAVEPVTEEPRDPAASLEKEMEDAGLGDVEKTVWMNRQRDDNWKTHQAIADLIGPKQSGKGAGQPYTHGGIEAVEKRAAVKMGEAGKSRAKAVGEQGAAQAIGRVEANVGEMEPGDEQRSNYATRRAVQADAAAGATEPVEPVQRPPRDSFEKREEDLKAMTEVFMAQVDEAQRAGRVVDESIYREYERKVDEANQRHAARVAAERKVLDDELRKANPGASEADLEHGREAIDEEAQRSASREGDVAEGGQADVGQDAGPPAKPGEPGYSAGTRRGRRAGSDREAQPHERGVPGIEAPEGMGAAGPTGGGPPVPPSAPGAAAPIVPERGGGKPAGGAMRRALDWGKRFASQRFAGTTRLDRETGEALSRADEDTTKQAATAKREEFGNLLRYGDTKFKDLPPEVTRYMGTVWMERRARRERERRRLAGEDASEVVTFVGQPGSPLQTEADYQQGLRDMWAFWQQIQAAWTPFVEGNLRGVKGLEPGDAIDSLSQIPGLPINAIALRAEDIGQPGVVAAGPRGMSGQRIRNPGWTRKAELNAPAYDVDLAHIMQRTLEQGIKARARAEFARTAFGSEVISQVGGTAPPPDGSYVAHANGKYIADATAGEAPPGWHYEPYTQQYSFLERNHKHPEGYKDLGLRPDNHLPGIDKTASYAAHPDAFREISQGLALHERPGQAIFGGIRPIMDAVYSATLMAPVELTAHIYNHIKALFAPGMRTWTIGLADTWMKTVKYLAKDPQTMRDISEIAAEGSWFDHKIRPGLLGEKLMNYDPTTIPQRISIPIIRVMQTAVRLQLRDAYRRITPEEKRTETGERDFINAGLGDYSSSAGNPLTVFLKDSRFQGFATAAHTFTMQGLKQATGGAINKRAETWGEAASLRATNLAKLLPLMALGPVYNYLKWGQFFPPDVPAFAMKTSEEEDGTVGHWDPLGLPGLRRGMRPTGQNALLEGLVKGQNFGQMLDKWGRDLTGTVAHALEGPPVNMAHVFFTGHNAAGYPVAKHVSEKEKKEGKSQWVENAKAAVLNVNSIVAAATGADSPNREVPLKQKIYKSLSGFAPRFTEPEEVRKARLKRSAARRRLGFRD